MISEGDIARMVEASRRLPDPAGNYIVEDFLVNLIATVIDFQTRTTAVERAVGHFKDRVRPQLRDLDDLLAVMERWPNTREGNTALAQYLWGYDMWTRARMLRDLVAYFVALGVTDQASLRSWAQKATFADFRGKVRGLGPAVFQWLVMRQGIDTVKPDVHVHRFVASVLGRRVSDEDAVRVLTEAARRLGRPAIHIDWAIWEAGRAGQTIEPRTRFGGTADRRTQLPGRGGNESGKPPRQPDITVATSGDGVVSFLDDDAGYLAWLGAHPGGFVLNSERNPRGQDLIVHRTDCRTINPDRRPADEAKTWTISYRKTCAPATGELLRWAIGMAGTPTPCGVCKPIL